MSRIINPESAGKERTQLSRAIILALRELMKQTQTDEHSKDLVAFIAVSLEHIYNTVEASVEAWEKRDYWLKADRFRMEWVWTRDIGAQMKKALFDDNWIEIARLSAKTGEKFIKVKVPLRHRIGTPWNGAWDELKRIQK